MYNTGQTAVFLKDLTGQEYPAIASVSRTKRVNGQRELTLSFLYTEINKDFMNDLEFGWQILFKGEWYTITHPGYSTDGDYFMIDVTAILSFFVSLNGYYMQDKAENKSSTPLDFFQGVFAGTPFSFVLVDSFSANTLSYQDNQSKTERFLYGIDRYSAEYVVRGNIVYIYSTIGSDKDVILHEDLNVNSVKVDVDASGFHTWAKGFGDLPEDDTEADYQLKVEYKSPLIAKYGEIEGPAFKDGNYKHAPTLTEAVKTQVENSYMVSTQIQAVDLTNNGYPEMVFEEGDRIWLYVDKLKLNQKVRVMEIKETFDWEGNIIDATYTVGNESISDRYKTQQYQILRDFKDIMSGRKPIEFNWLPEAIKRASEIINGNEDSLFRYGAGEIIGINQNNPNGYMRFNTDGIGFSRDGGKTYRTAMTYEGIVADAITTGSLMTNNVKIIGRDNYFYWDGNALTAIDPNNPNKRLDLRAGMLEIKHGAISIERPDGYKSIMNGIMQNDFNVQFYRPQWYNAPVTQNYQWMVTNSTTYGDFDAFNYKHVGRYLRIGVLLRVDDPSAQATIRVRNEYDGSFVAWGSSSSTIGEAVGITIDLGTPTGNRNAYTLQLRTSVPNVTAHVRIIQVFGEG